MARINKARYWWAVLWLENLPADWQETISDILQLPFVYCIHSADLDTAKEKRKDHVHIIIAFPNTTTYSHALEVFRLIGGEKAVNTCQAVINMRHAYDYLIHKTDACKKAGKHLYRPDERVSGNLFDIGLYEQTSQADKDAKLHEIIQFIRDNGFLDMAEFYDGFYEVYCEDSLAFDVFKSYNSILDRIIKGNYSKYKRRQEAFYAEQERIRNEQKFQEKNDEKNEEEIDENLDDFEDENREKIGEGHVYFGDILPKIYVTCDEEKPQVRGGSNFSDSSKNDDYQHAKIAFTNTQRCCHECGSFDLEKYGKTKAGTQRFRCKDCGKVFTLD